MKVKELNELTSDADSKSADCCDKQRDLEVLDEDVDLENNGHY